MCGALALALSATIATDSAQAVPRCTPGMGGGGWRPIDGFDDNVPAPELGVGENCLPFGDIELPPIVKVPPLDAAIERVDVPSVMAAGEEYTVTVVALNKGQEIWQPASAHKLASRSGDWARPPISVGSTVMKGKSHVFTFKVRAPSSPGLHPFQWQMIRSGAEWFGEATPARTVEVRGAAANIVTRRFTYDQFKRLCKVSEPETGATVYEYDAAGNMIWSSAGLPVGDANDCGRTEAYGSGRRVDRSYDSRGRLIRLTFPDGNGSQSISYTPDGLRTEVVTRNGAPASTVINRYAYNRRRLATSETQTVAGRAFSIKYSYDSLGNRTGIQYPSGRAIQMNVDAVGRVRGVSDQAGKPIASSILYHPSGAMSHMRYGNGVVRNVSLNTRMLAQLVDDSGILSQAYVYDSNGNVISIRDSRGAGFDRVMEYDGLNRLTSAASGSFGGGGLVRFAYDGLDNLLSISAPGKRDHAFWYDQNNRLTNVSDASGGTVVGLAYDAQGNLKARNGRQFTFDFGNRLRSVSDGEGYSYDASGHRVVALDPLGQRLRSLYSDDGMLFTEERRGAGMVDFVLLDGKTIAEILPSGISYLHADQLGSPAARSLANGSTQSRAVYEPYGELVENDQDGVGFAGHVRDTGTKLNYMQQRYYDPQVGRFLSVDPVSSRQNPSGAFNRYWYANNNPYTNIDPDGRECNGQGCWVTPMERAAAESGNWREYYHLAAMGGDRYAARGFEVATNTGSNALNAWLSEKTNGFLAQSIAIRQGYDLKSLSTAEAFDIHRRMEGIRKDLVLGHMRALDARFASPENPVSLPRPAIGDFHDFAFERNGADPDAFGGYKMDAADKFLSIFGISVREFYDYCPQPSCSSGKDD